MKTKPMAHQTEGLKRLLANPNYALGAEQGTGKTWMMLAEAEVLFEAGKATGALIVAPSGVHRNWIIREATAHLSCAWVGFSWSPNKTKKRERELGAFIRSPEGKLLKLFAINYEALLGEHGAAAVRAFMAARGRIVYVDESHRIKNQSSATYKRLVALTTAAARRRIASGTLTGDNPLDVFAQYNYLRRGLLGTNSYRAFVAEHAVLIHPNSPEMYAIQARRPSRGPAPQVVAKDVMGRPMFKNLERLAAKMRPWTFRVTKSECLDLPPKIYQTRQFTLPPAQRTAYEVLVSQARAELESGEVQFEESAVFNKIRQVTSGFVMVDGKAESLRFASERIATLRAVVLEETGQFIVWACYTAELDLISKMLRDEGISHAVYAGATTSKERDAAIDDFQSGRIQAFVGHPRAGGTGLTLTAAGTAIYYSNEFELVSRLQSEDRCHRIGTTRPVLYIDIVAEDTIDEKIAAVLQAKKELSAKVLGLI